MRASRNVSDQSLNSNRADSHIVSYQYHSQDQLSLPAEAIANSDDCDTAWNQQTDTNVDGQSNLSFSQQLNGAQKSDLGTSWPTTSSSPPPWPHSDLPSTPPSTTPIEPPAPPNRAIYPLQTSAGYRVTVQPYDPSWPSQFLSIKTHLHTLFTTSTPPAPYTTIEHIGSTSIPNLAAKPNIDVLVTFSSPSALSQGIEALEWEIPTTPPFQRYARVPDGGGIQGRESFKLYVRDTSPYYYSTPERSVYLIDESEENSAGRVQIRCYRSVKDTLMDPRNEDLKKEYGEVKMLLGEKVFDDSVTYSRLKDEVVRKILRRAGWTEEEVDEKETLSRREFVVDELPY